MTFIELLQQGGYILPQYSNAQQTIAVPNAGLQALNTMMQIDQQSQNNNIQNQQLLLQKQQSGLNTLNTVLDNKLKLQQSEKLMQQMELSNQKLKFQMQKEIIDQVEEDRKYLKDNYLERDRINIEKTLDKMGLNDTQWLGNMKGDLNYENYLHHKFSKDAVISANYKAIDNKQKHGKAKEILTRFNENIKRAEGLMAKGIPINSQELMELYAAGNKASEQLLQFESGKLEDLDLTNADWSKAGSLGDVLDQKEYANQLQVAQDLTKAKTDIALAETQYTKAQIEQELPMKMFELSTKALKSFGESAPLLTELSSLGINYDPNNPGKLYQDLMSANQVTKDAVIKILSKYDSGTKDEKFDMDKTYIQAVIDKNVPVQEAILRLRHGNYSSNSSTFMEGNLRVNPIEGTKVTSSGDLAGLIVKPNNTVGTLNLEVETSGTNKGKAKLPIKGKDYYVTTYKDGAGKAYLKFSSSDLHILEEWLGDANPGLFKFKSLESYTKDTAGDAYVDGAKMEGEYLLIPAGTGTASTTGSTGAVDLTPYLEK